MALDTDSLLNDIHHYDEHSVINSNKSKSSINSLYCLKALGAFLVVCIHSYSPWIIYPVVRTAVPLFFIISGYFLYKEDSNEALSRCIKAFKKIFWLTLYANIFYYLCFKVPNNLFPIKTVKSLFIYLAFGDRMSYHLWYLNAYLEVLLIMIIVLKLRMLKLVWWCIPFGIIVGLLLGKYNFLFKSIPNSLILSRNFFTIGIPCVGIGWLLKKYHFRLSKLINSPVYLVLILLVLSEIEMIILHHYNLYILRGDYIITTIPLAASIVFACIKYSSFGRKTTIERIGKKYSTSIYVFHIFILDVFIIINNETLNLPYYTFPFIVFILTILFIKVLGKCSKKIF